jgi:hypothetical protein
MQCCFPRAWEDAPTAEDAELQRESELLSERVGALLGDAPAVATEPAAQLTLARRASVRAQWTAQQELAHPLASGGTLARRGHAESEHARRTLSIIATTRIPEVQLARQESASGGAALLAARLAQLGLKRQVVAGARAAAIDARGAACRCTGSSRALTCL